MASHTKNQSLDWIALSLFLSLILVGWILIYATTHQSGDSLIPINWNSDAGKQLIWIGISLVAFVVSSFVDWKLWEAFAYPIFIAVILLLIGVLIFGYEVKGAKSWFVFGYFSFQPSELAKLATCLALSNYLASFKTDLRFFKSFAIAASIFVVPATLILLQPDAGSALVFGSFFILLYKKGLSATFYIIGISLIATFIIGYQYGLPVVLALMLLISLLIQFLQLENKQYWILSILPLAFSVWIGFNAGYTWEAIVSMLIINAIFLIILWSQNKQQMMMLMTASLMALIAFSFGINYTVSNILKPHQRDRINVWLKPEQCDPQGSLYNLMQSKLAISSGGIQGKGFLQGARTRLNYVPEQSTDFIFSAVGEEHGFIGVVTIIMLFLILVIRIIKIAERARHAFIQNFAYGIAGIFFIHFFLNIGMTMGLTPVIGIPLPFLSKGGSSLLVFSVMMGLLMRMDLARLRR